MFEYNGVSMEFDLFDLDTFTKKEEAVSKASEKLEEIEELRKTDPVSAMKFQCDMVRWIFDHIFGDGSGKKICGEVYNLRNHMAAFYALVDEMGRQDKELEGMGIELVKKHKPNRATRRATVEKK